MGAGLITMGGMGNIAAVFLKRQIWFFVVGGGMIFLFSAVDYRIFKNYSLPSVMVYLVAVALLLVTLASTSVRGINAWISIGAFRLEPSEVAKLALVILLAKYFSQKHVEIYRVHHLIASGFYAGLLALIVLIQPDLGSAFVLFVIWLAMLLAAGIKRNHLLAILAIVAIFSLLAWSVFMQTYQKNRILSFLNPYLDPQGEGYSVIQSKIAIGSGGWWGNGFGNGTQSKFGFLPEAHTDFAFASFAEQFGLAGVVTSFALLLAMFLRIGKIGFSARNNFTRLFSIGFMTLIFVHVVINAGMNLGLLPITGISFPFLSYGGSFLMTLTAGIGIIQSISLRR